MCLVCLRTAGSVANSVDPDQMLYFAASDLGLHCLLKPPLNTCGKYRIICLFAIFLNNNHLFSSLLLTALISIFSSLRCSRMYALNPCPAEPGYTLPL